MNIGRNRLKQIITEELIKLKERSGADFLPSAEQILNDWKERQQSLEVGSEARNVAEQYQADLQQLVDALKGEI